MVTYNYLLGLWGKKKKGGGLAIDVSSEPVFLSKKRRISTDVSSGPISLTKKKKKLKPKIGNLLENLGHRRMGWGQLDGCPQRFWLLRPL